MKLFKKCHDRQADSRAFTSKPRAGTRVAAQDAYYGDIIRSRNRRAYSRFISMGLLINHLDIDIHVYSTDVTLQDSFAIMAKIAENESVIKIECRNLLHTEEACIEWHVWVKDDEDKTWQIDIIHILRGSRYDGFFERMAERINDVLTTETRTTILRLKYETSGNEHVMGVEYYQAVLRDGIRTLGQFNKWRELHKPNGIIEWIP